MALLEAGIAPASAAEHPEAVADTHRAPGGGGLSFDAPGGPAVAVCGLCGGAGASTLAYTLAAAAASRSSAPVFACETGGIGAGLAVYARAHGRASLEQAANQLASGHPPEGLVASSPEGVRILASRPGLPERCDAEAAGSILEQAQAAGGLVVLDCGTGTHELDRLALAAASHVLWVMPATGSGLVRAEGALELLAPGVDGRQALVARLDRVERTARVPELSELAVRWRAPLILFPHVEDIAETLVEEAIEEAQVALEAIATVIAR